MSTKRDHHAQRQHLLDQWLRLLASEGYNAASMRRLAKVASVSTGTLYHYFPTKAAILHAAFERISDEGAATDALPADADLDTRMALVLDAVEAHRDDLRTALLISLEMVRHGSDTASRDAVVATRTVYHRRLARALGTEDEATVMLRYMMGSLLDELFVAPSSDAPPATFEHLAVLAKQLTAAPPPAN